MLVLIKHLITFISPTLTQLNVSISNVICIPWRVEGKGMGGEAKCHLPYLFYVRIVLNDYLDCVKAEKNDKPVFK